MWISGIRISGSSAPRFGRNLFYSGGIDGGEHLTARAHDRHGRGRGRVDTCCLDGEWQGTRRRRRGRPRHVAAGSRCSDARRGVVRALLPGEPELPDIVRARKRGQIAEVGEVVACVAQANTAPGGATYQAVSDAFIAMANRLETAAVDARRPGIASPRESKYLRAAKFYAQALYWVPGTSTPGAEADVYRVMDHAFTAAMELIQAHARTDRDPLRGAHAAWVVHAAGPTTAKRRPDDHHEQRERRPERRHARRKAALRRSSAGTTS